MPDFEMADYSRSSFIMNKEDFLDPPEKGFGDPPDLKVNFPIWNGKPAPSAPSAVRKIS